VGQPRALTRVVHNGVRPEEFAAVSPHSDATDLVFVGELRALKGIDLLIEAVALLAREGKKVTLTIAGDGPDRDRLGARVTREGLAEAIRFVGPMPAREAFAMGRLLVVCSRAESLPYIVIEGAAAGMPMLATRVGGIPEISGLLPVRSCRLAMRKRSRRPSGMRWTISAPPQPLRSACAAGYTPLFPTRS